MMRVGVMSTDTTAAHYDGPCAVKRDIAIAPGITMAALLTYTPWVYNHAPRCTDDL